MSLKKTLASIGISALTISAILGAVYFGDGNDKKVAFVVFNNVRMTQSGQIVENDVLDQLDTWILENGSSTDQEIQAIYTEYKKISKKDIYTKDEQTIRLSGWNAKLYEIRKNCKKETERCREVKVKD